MSESFSHLDSEGKARMVDVSGKDDTFREASAQVEVIMKAELIDMIKDRKIPKGDVFSVAKCAGIMGAKQTSTLIPLCHQIPLSHVDIEFYIEKDRVVVKSKARTCAKTGVEMEALTAVSVAALTIYDMCKAVDKGIVITDMKLMKKSGGKSGDFAREDY